MEFKKEYFIGISIGFVILVLNFMLFFDFSQFQPNARWFAPLLAVAFVVASSQFWLDLFKENKRQKQIEINFLEFVRAVVGTVKSGIPIPKAIIQVSKEDFGNLTPHVKKMANQIEWGFPTREALLIFSGDTRNKVIRRSVAIVIEAEKSGGNIGDVLEAVTSSVMEIKKMKEERIASTYSQVVQGYIVFFVFIGIMLILQLKLLPQITSMSGTVLTNIGGSITGQTALEGVGSMNLDRVFTSLILIQGFFAGLMVGKFSEGTLRYGLKHSLILMVVGYIILTTIRGI